MGSTVKRFLQERQAILTSAAAFVGFLVAATVLMAQEDKHHGDSDCDWNEFGEVVCFEPTNTATATTKPPPTVDHAATAQAVAALTAEASAAQTAEAIAALTAEAIVAQTAAAIATQTAAAQATLTAIAQQTTVIVDPNRPQTATAIARLTQTAAAALTATAAAEPTWTPTPTPTPGSSGWVSPSSVTINEGQSVTLTAGWSPSSLDTHWVLTDTRVLWRSSRCSGTTTKSPPEDDVEGSASLTVWGCYGGRASVDLRDRRTGKVLGSSAITVKCVNTCTPTPPTEPPPPPLSPPTWNENAYEMNGYRWINVDWRGAPAFSSYRLRWRELSQTGWTNLTSTSDEWARINLFNTSAEVRGLPHGWVALQVIGETDDGRTAVSNQLIVNQGPAPAAIGHQHDHLVTYNLSGLGASRRDAMLKASARSAAATWNRESYISLREETSPTNDQKITVVWRSNRDACGDSIACFGASGNVDTHIGNATMTFEQPPYWGSGKGNSPYRLVRWTRGRSLHGEETQIIVGERWQYLDTTVLHEFGHAVGLSHAGTGIMWSITLSGKARPAAVLQSDRDLLHRIYENHRAGAGWTR